jgi:hypothetical protein
MENFTIVLFKNKKKKKIIKGYMSEKNALNKFNNLVNNNNIEFEVLFENSERCNYEIALLSKIDNYQIPLYKMDEIGRNNSVFIEGDSDYTIKKISDYKIEEMIFDWVTNKRITFNEFIEKYCSSKELKLFSKLHNKVVLQKDEVFNIFSLKNEEDSERFLQTLESYFYKNGRTDSIFVRDESIVQRKWLYKILEKNGFDIKKLYRQKTTFSKRI